MQFIKAQFREQAALSSVQTTGLESGLLGFNPNSVTDPICQVIQVLIQDSYLSTWVTVKQVSSPSELDSAILPPTEVKVGVA